MSEHYDFHYQPTGSGAISGQQVLQQTEDAINELGDYVNDNVGGAMDVAQQALETAQNAEQDAQTALDTANSFSSAIQSAQQDASTALSTAQTAQTTASNANNTAIQASQDASSAVTTANNASGQVSTLSGTVTTLGQRVTTAEGNIGQNTSDITALTTRVGTAEGNITTLQNDVSIAQGNASSAMATAGQVKQQAFVFRYSSTALVASSTNSNTLLDNTDNLKVGDKVIDSSGVLFSVTAIDTQNSTFTIGTALIDLAQDSDVVHKSGDETIGGVKTFSDNISTKKIISNVAQLQINARSNADSVAIIAGADASDGGGLWLYGKNSGVSSDCRLQIYNTTKSRYERVDLVGSQFLPSPSGEIDCGGTSNKWKSVYATNYYYGSSDTEFSDKFVTTDTAQTIGQNKTFTGVIIINHARGGIFQLTCPDLDNTIDVTGNWAEFISFNSVDGGQTVASKGAVGLRQFKNGKNFALLLVEGSETLYFGSKSNSDSTKALYPANSGICDLGTSTNKWKTFNGLNPSSLSLPDLSNGIDISSYITIGDTDNNYYTPPANGWIWIKAIGNGLAITQGDFGITANYVAHTGTGEKWVEANLLVTKDIQATIRCRNITGIVGAKFYPCQGNV